MEKRAGRCGLTVGTSRKTQVARRFSQLRKTFKVDTQEVRTHAIKRLKELFDLSSDFAKGAYRFQYEKGKREPLTIKQRQMWARIAAYIAQIMNTIVNGIDERQIDEDLTKLEKLVNEATAANGLKGSGKEDGKEKGAAAGPERQS